MNTAHEPIDDGTSGTPGDEIHAGEYVLGVLDAEERREVQARMAAEPAFAALVVAWEQRFSTWLEDTPAIAPGAHVWPRIRGSLGWPSVEATRPRAWDSVAFWRGATALATAAGLAALVFGLQPRGPRAPPAPAVIVQQPLPAPAVEEAAARPVTVLARDDGSTGWIASLDAAAGKVLMVPVPSPADDAGRVNELWLIPEGGAPLSLGFVSSEKAHTIAIPDAVRRVLAVGGTLAITLEPGQGMPHAAPSGPIVAKGGILQI